MIKFKKEPTGKKTQKQKFKEIKEKIQAAYPNASTKKDLFGNYYVVNESGFRIIPDDCRINNSHCVIDAWKNALEFLSVKHIIQSNDNRFSPFKMADNTMAKIINQK